MDLADSDLSQFLSLAIALAAGAIIGFERESVRARESAEERGFEGLGVRTFTLIALAGGLAGVVVDVAGAWVLATGLVSITALVVTLYLRAPSGARVGLTTEVAAVVTYVVGALAGLGRWHLCIAVAIAVTGLLAFKQPLHRFAGALAQTDVDGAVKFALIAFVLLPLLPDRSFGPYGVLNPFEMWMLVVLIAGLSFAGYVAIKVLGTRAGVLVTGLLGGLASSTAVTLSFAGRARENPALTASCALAILVASSTMFARVAVETYVVSPALFWRLLPALAAMTVSGAAAALVVWFRSGTSEGELRLRNPFSLSSAIKFGVFFGAVMLGSRWAQEQLGAAGLYLSAVIAGLTDVDAITLSAARLTLGGTPLEVAGRTIVLAVISNTVVKVGLAMVLGTRALGLRLLAAFAVVALAGAGVAFLQ